LEFSRSLKSGVPGTAKVEAGSITLSHRSHEAQNKLATDDGYVLLTNTSPKTD